MNQITKKIILGTGGGHSELSSKPKSPSRDNDLDQPGPRDAL
jgi:hypothetical protein